MFLIVENSQPGILCDRCNVRKLIQVYHCSACNYDVCTPCAAKGMGCGHPQHVWIERHWDEDGRVSDIHGRPTPARNIMKAYKSYPELLSALDPSIDIKSLYANEHRFIRKNNPRRMLIYTDGACLGNGQSNPQAGYAFVFRPSAFDKDGNLTHPGSFTSRLEDKGPYGQLYKQTSNRAELRAVIAALQVRDWATDCNESWNEVVFATDSEYVAFGATTWIKSWESEGFKTFDRNIRQHVDVKNQDLWRVLLWEIRRLLAQGVKVLFSRIPREHNTRADENAKLAAQMPRITEFRQLIATGSGPLDYIMVPYRGR